jgi:hypothetical protein
VKLFAFRQYVRQHVEGFSQIIDGAPDVFRAALRTTENVTEAVERLARVLDELLGVLGNVPKFLLRLPAINDLFDFVESDIRAAERRIHSLIADAFPGCPFEGAERRVGFLERALETNIPRVGAENPL